MERISETPAALDGNSFHLLGEKKKLNSKCTKLELSKDPFSGEAQRGLIETSRVLKG